MSAKPSKKIEEAFEDIMPYEDINSESHEISNVEESDSKPKNEDKDESAKLSHLKERMETLDKIDLALDKVNRLDSLDEELDAIASHAIQSHSELFEKAGSYADGHAGSIYDVSARYLSIALDAKGSKLTRKLKTIELQLKKAKLEQDEKKKSDEDDDEGLSANELKNLLTNINLSKEDFDLKRDEAKGGTD